MGDAIGIIGAGRLGQALAQIRPHLEAIDDRFNGVFAAHIEFRRLIQFHDGAVDALEDLVEAVARDGETVVALADDGA